MIENEYKSFCHHTSHALARRMGYRDKKHLLMFSAMTIAVLSSVNYKLCNHFMQEASPDEIFKKVSIGTILGAIFLEQARKKVARTLYSKPLDQRVSNLTGTFYVIAGQASGYSIGNVLAHNVL